MSQTRPGTPRDIAADADADASAHADTGVWVGLPPPLTRPQDRSPSVVCSGGEWGYHWPLRLVLPRDSTSFGERRKRVEYRILTNNMLKT